jgi:Flp pilus assembly protein protease CpaA
MSQQMDKLAEAPTHGVLAGPRLRPAADSPAKPRGFLGWPQAWILLVSLAAVGAMITTTVNGHTAYFIRALGIGVVLVAAWYDSATNRIPNALTYPAIVLGIVLNTLLAMALFSHAFVMARWLGFTAVAYPVEPMQESLWGFGACAGIGIVSMLLGGIHGGDMKLIAAMGALFGLHAVCAMLLWALAVVIPLALINLLLDRKLTQFFHFAGLQLMNWIWLHKNEPVLEVTAKRIPIAVPLAAGVILALSVPAQTLPALLTGGA